MNTLYFSLFHFLRDHLKPSSRILLAFSGGPDSMALLTLLLEIQKKIKFELELAHVDHNMRKESLAEAIEIKKLAQSLDLCLHQKRLTKETQGNLENYYRQARFDFFKTVMAQKEYQALLLAHQKEDLQETVLKRFLEGASFEKLMGMQALSSKEGVTLWRPLLKHSKAELLAWLEENNISYFQDCTNENEAFLRARMRKTLIPTLEHSFKKSVRENLVRYADSSHRLCDYLEEKTQGLRKGRMSSWGKYYDFSKPHVHPYEIEFAIRSIFRSSQKNLSFDQKELILRALLEGKANLKLEIKDRKVCVDRKRLFILNQKKYKKPAHSLSLTQGQHLFGPWVVEVEKGKREKSNHLGMNCLFTESSRFFIQLPKDDYTLKIPDLKKDSFYFDKKLSKWFQDHKIPRCLWELTPVIQRDQKVIAEVLTEKTPFMLKENHLNITISAKKH